jgi:hypothetical protein
LKFKIGNVLRYTTGHADKMHIVKITSINSSLKDYHYELVMSDYGGYEQGARSLCSFDIIDENYELYVIPMYNKIWENLIKETK